MNSFINAQFSYWPVILMFHDRYLNAKVNKIHERPLRIVYKNTHTDCEALLNIDNALSVHQRNLQCLMTEIYKTKNGLGPSFMRELFKPRDLQYNSRNKNFFDIPKVRTTSYDIETVQFIGRKLWQMLPPKVRESPSLMAFKKELGCRTINCDCSARHLYPGLVLSNFVSFSLGYFIYYIFFFSTNSWP